MAHRQTAGGPLSSLRRECFVTVGATASFRALIDAVLSSSFLNTLSDLRYSHLTIQCGPDLAYVNSKIRDEASSSQGWKGMKIKTFDFNKLGLGAEMKDCKEVGGKSMEGVVVCHAGAGTVLDAMRLDVPIIVVPNPALLDNHQAELAEELERQGYVTYGRLNDISAALKVSEERSKARKAWRPQETGTDPTRTGIAAVMDDEVGFELSTREVLD